MPERSQEDAYTRKDRGKHDRFRKTRMYTDEQIISGVLRYGFWRAPTFDTDDVERHTVTAADLGHMDAIAKKHYGDERLWWVIAWANRVKNPITDMFIGQQLAIPELRLIAQALDDVI